MGKQASRNCVRSLLLEKISTNLTIFPNLMIFIGMVKCEYKVADYSLAIRLISFSECCQKIISLCRVVVLRQLFLFSGLKNNVEGKK